MRALYLRTATLIFLTAHDVTIKECMVAFRKKKCWLAFRKRLKLKNSFVLGICDFFWVSLGRKFNWWCLTFKELTVAVFICTLPYLRSSDVLIWQQRNLSQKLYFFLSKEGGLIFCSYGFTLQYYLLKSLDVYQVFGKMVFYR